MAKTTLDDLARELNLCRSSVGRALSDRGGNTRISEATRQRVREAASRLGYQSHAAARALRTKRFHNIGFFVMKKAPFDYAYAESIFDGLADAAAEYGQNIVLVQLPRTSERVDDIPRALREHCLDAIVVFDTADLPEGFVEAVEEARLPVVYLNEKRPRNAIYVDDVLTGRTMTRHLLDRGYRRISMVGNDVKRSHYSLHDRIAGYSEEMRAAGLEPEVRLIRSSRMDEEAGAWLGGLNRPQAVFCHSDMVALQLQRELYRMRMRIPDDIALAGCDGEDHAFRSTVPLTTMQIPFRAMAAEAVRMAIQRITQPDPEGVPSTVFQSRLLTSVSTGCEPTEHPFVLPPPK